MARYCGQVVAYWNGRRILNHALPGDEDVLLADLKSRAILRDGQFNHDEWCVYLCTKNVLRYGLCVMPMCEWCGGGDYYMWRGVDRFFRSC